MLALVTRAALTHDLNILRVEVIPHRQDSRRKSSRAWVKGLATAIESSSFEEDGDGVYQWKIWLIPAFTAAKTLHNPFSLIANLRD